MLRVCEQAHGEGICHGDIKAENVVVTSWSWALLTDFASFKPTYDDQGATVTHTPTSSNSPTHTPNRYLPEDDHSDFAYFFDNESRRRCYVAPERFRRTATASEDLDRSAISSPKVGGGRGRGGGTAAVSSAAPAVAIPVRAGSAGASQGAPPAGAAPQAQDGSDSTASLLENLMSTGMDIGTLETELGGGDDAAGGEQEEAAGQGRAHGGGADPPHARDYDAGAGAGGLRRAVPRALPPVASRPASSLREGMDIFSAGCVIAELFLDGSAVFDLSALLKYRTNEFNPRPAVATIRDAQVEVCRNPAPSTHASKRRSPVVSSAAAAAAQELVMHMIQLDPMKRASAAHYMKHFQGAGKLFPAYFGGFMHDFMAAVLWPENRTPDARVRWVCANYEGLLREVCGVVDTQGAAYFRHCLSLDEYAAGGGQRGSWEWDWRWRPTEGGDSDNKQGLFGNTVAAIFEPWTPMKWKAPSPPQTAPAAAATAATAGAGSGAGAGGDGAPDAAAAVTTPASGLQTADVGVALSDQVTTASGEWAASANAGSRLQDLLADTDAFLTSLEDATSDDDAIAEAAVDGDASLSNGHAAAAGAPAAGAPTTAAEEGAEAEAEATPAEEPFTGDTSGVTIVVSLLCTTIRHVSLPQSKLTALALLARLAVMVDDETRLQRIVPYVVALLNDTSAPVRAHALYVVAQQEHTMHCDVCLTSPTLPQLRLDVSREPSVGLSCQ